MVFFLLIFLALMSPVLAAEALAEPSQQVSPEKQTNRQIPPPLRVYAFHAAPFLYLDEAGHTAGLEFDILSSFAASEDRELEIIWADKAVIRFDLFESMNIDLFAGNLTITEERKEFFDYSSPFFIALTLLIERRGEESADFSDLQGKRLATIAGSSYEDMLQEIPGVEIVYVDPKASHRMNRALFDMAASGAADGLAIDSPQYLWLADKYPNLTLTLGISEPRTYGFAARPGDPLRDRLNRHLDKLRAAGTMRELMSSAFPEWDLQAIDEMLRDLKNFEEDSDPRQSSDPRQ